MSAGSTRNHRRGRCTWSKRSLNSDRGRGSVTLGRQSARGGSLRLLQAGDAGSLRPFAEKYPFKPYHYYDDLNQRRLAAYFHRELCERLAPGPAYSWVVQDQRKG